MPGLWKGGRAWSVETLLPFRWGRYLWFVAVEVILPVRRARQKQVTMAVSSHRAPGTRVCVCFSVLSCSFWSPRSPFSACVLFTHPHFAAAILGFVGPRHRCALESFSPRSALWGQGSQLSQGTPARFAGVARTARGRAIMFGVPRSSSFSQVLADRSRGTTLSPACICF